MRSTTSDWSHDLDRPCDSTLPIYCFEVFPTDYPHRRVFVTAEEFNPGVDFASIPQATALCDARGDPAATWDAWISNDGNSVGGRFTANDTPWVRLDGVMVALHDSDLHYGPLLAPINVTETGTELPAGTQPVWTGTNGNGNHFDPDCMSWTSAGASQFASYGDANTTGSGIWSYFDALSCDNDGRLYCFEQ